MKGFGASIDYKFYCSCCDAEFVGEDCKGMDEGDNCPECKVGEIIDLSEFVSAEDNYERYLDAKADEMIDERGL